MIFFCIFSAKWPPQEESKCKNAQFLQWILKDDDVYFQKITASKIWGNSFIMKNIGFLHNMLPPQYSVTGPWWVKMSPIRYLNGMVLPHFLLSGWYVTKEIGRCVIIPCVTVIREWTWRNSNIRISSPIWILEFIVYCGKYWHWCWCIQSKVLAGSFMTAKWFYAWNVGYWFYQYQLSLSFVND